MKPVNGYAMINTWLRKDSGRPIFPKTFLMSNINVIEVVTKIWHFPDKN